MGDPTKYLPSCTIDDIHKELSSIGLPSARTVTQLTVGAAYHKVFRLTYSTANYRSILEKTAHTLGILNHVHDLDSTSDARTEANTSLILRISGSHVPEIKTMNEIGILGYLTKHTTIPIPHIVHHDADTSNSLRSEYMIMTLLPGLNGSDIYSSLTQSQISYILDQLAVICLDLYRLDFTHIGGLKPDHNLQKTTFPQPQADVPHVPGPPVMETMWQSPNIDECFNKPSLTKSTNQPSTEYETLHTLNAISPTGYKSYTSWLAAQMHVYIHAIRIHPSLHWVLDQDPSLTALTAFTTTLESNSTLQFKLNSVPLKLAHRDLHFGNILLSPEPSPAPAASSTTASTTPNQPYYRITGVLDWEFATILPFPLWRQSFLRDGVAFDPQIHTDVTEREFYARSGRARDEIYGEWARKVAGLDGGKQMLKDMKWRCREQEWAWDVVNYLRCVVEVCPRGIQLDDARGWWKEVVRALGGFGIKIAG